MSFHKILLDCSKKDATKENRDQALAELKALIDAGGDPTVVPDDYPDVFGLVTLKNLDAIKFAYGLGLASIGAAIKHYHTDKKLRDNPNKVLGKRSRRYE